MATKTTKRATKPTKSPTQTAKRADPKQKGAKPPFPKQEQEPPGTETEMRPKPDHGENSYRGSGKLTGKVALITGADSGIGRAVALAYAREGADVLISYLSEDRDAEETKRIVEAAGRRAVVVPGDIADERHCQELVRRCVDELGKLDILVNNAAHQRLVPKLDDLSAEQLDRHFRVNVYALVHLVKAALPHLKPGSAIVNTTSIEAFDPAPPLAAYAATKAATANLTMSLAHMFADRGIRVNAVAPGPIWTPLIPMSFPADSVKTFGQDVPLKRPGQPRELAPVYVLLASDEASYVTGMIYGVTGGKLLL
jgi:NAD(P)-dependent dehydrogenase (short-subunit alcohol dehydrogenase family)